MLKRLLKAVILVVIVLFVLIQFFPYGRTKTNPSVRLEPAWDSPETRDLAKRACFDCHSNGTVWPWYSHVAPVSWLVQRDVEEGRQHVNFSEWDVPQPDADESAEMVRKGEMPLGIYVSLHPEANLNANEKQALIRGLEITFGKRSNLHREKTEEREESQ